ncbi:MAG: T9SS type A sorting domain-containing protein [Chitinophagales bacterium]|nr:T9SS type A sorting domain-containing protein [Chitinophagales bacterium]
MADATIPNQEYFSGKLVLPLKRGKKYCVEYYLKRGTAVYGVENWASDGFGIYFSQDSLVNDGCCLPPYTPQIKNPDGNVIYDTSWIAMSGSFIAEGGERYFIVGNFKDADQTTFDPPSPYASTYYFFDDFSVWYCDSTTITEIEIDPLLPHQHLPPDTADGNPELPLIIPNLLSVYGNSIWQIGNLQPNTEVTLYNALGQLVYHTVYYANNLHAAELAAGMYLYRISRADKEDVIGKLVVIR